MKNALKAALLLASLCALLLLSGCFAKSTDELYALPQLSEGYIQLQSELRSLLDSGAEYSAPTAGSNRQAIQLEDLDGDGIQTLGQSSGIFFLTSHQCRSYSGKTTPRHPLRSDVR